MSHPRLIACVLGALAFPVGASAQRGPTETTAQSQYALGSSLYAAGRFTEAAAAFEAAWAASGRPELLFNVGRAWEDAGDDARALDAYTRFERAGAPGIDRPVLAQRIAAVRARAAARSAVPAARSVISSTPVAPTSSSVAPAPQVSGPSVPLHPPSPSPSGRDLTGPVVLLASGGVLLLGAIPLWVTASVDADELARRCPSRRCTSQSDIELRNDAYARALIGDVLGGLGVVAAVAGGTWLALTLRSNARATASPRAGMWCGASGCVGAVRWNF